MVRWSARPAVAGLVLAAAAALGDAQSGTVVTSGRISLGVHESGRLLYQPSGGSLVGVKVDDLDLGIQDPVATLSALQEGWGVTANDQSDNLVSDLFTQFNGSPQSSYTSTAITSSSASEVTTVTSDDNIEVTHEFKPLAVNIQGWQRASMYQVHVTIKNLRTDVLKDVVYRRITDLDVGGTSPEHKIGRFGTFVNPTGPPITLVQGLKDVLGGGCSASPLSNSCSTVSTPVGGFTRFQESNGVGMDIALGNLDPGVPIKFTLVVGGAKFKCDNTYALNTVDAGIRMLAHNRFRDTIRTPIFRWVCTGGYRCNRCFLGCCGYRCLRKEYKLVGYRTRSVYRGRAYFWAALTDSAPSDEPIGDDILDTIDAGEGCDLKEFNSNFDSMTYINRLSDCTVCEGSAPQVFKDMWLDLLSLDPAPLKAQRLTFYTTDIVPVPCEDSWAYAVRSDGEVFRSPLLAVPGNDYMCIVDFFAVFDKPADYNDLFRIVYALADGIAVDNTEIWVDDADKEVVDHIVTLEELTEPTYFIKTFDVADKANAPNEYVATITLEEGLYSTFGDPAMPCSLPSQIDLLLSNNPGATDTDCKKTCQRTAGPTSSSPSTPSTATYTCELDIDDVGDCGKEYATAFDMAMEVDIPFDAAYFGDTLPSGDEKDWCFFEAFSRPVDACFVDDVPARPMLPDAKYTLLLSKGPESVEDTTENQGNELTQLIVTIDGPPDFEPCEGFTPTAQMILPIKVVGFDQQKIQDFLDDIEGDLAIPDLTYQKFEARIPVATVNGDTLELVEGSVDVGCTGTPTAASWTPPGSGLTEICFKMITTTCQPMNLNSDATKCEFNKVGYADIEVMTCCETAELKRTVVPDSPLFDANCPVPDDSVD
ncbi:PEP-CTERM domain-containing protein, partial [Durusdinium trenchii]